MKKIISICVFALVALGSTLSVLAGTEAPTVQQNSIQQIVSTINQEYGLNFEMPITARSQSSSISPQTVIQFENELREAAEVLAKEKADSEAILAYTLSQPDVTTTPAISRAMPGDKTIRRTGTVTGAIVTANGWVRKSNGFDVWVYLTDVTTQYGNDSNKYRFQMNAPGSSYSAYYWDSNRAVTVTVNGTLYTSTVLGWVPSASSPSLVFWAY